MLFYQEKYILKVLYLKGVISNLKPLHFHTLVHPCYFFMLDPTTDQVITMCSQLLCDICVHGKSQGEKGRPICVIRKIQGPIYFLRGHNLEICFKCL